MRCRLSFSWYSINKWRYDDTGILFLLCITDIYSKHVGAVPLKDKKDIAFTKDFPKIFGESNCKPKKIWVGKRRKFYNRSRKSWLQENNIDIYSTCN